jgi:hypothetical protein
LVRRSGRLPIGALECVCLMLPLADSCDLSIADVQEQQRPNPAHSLTSSLQVSSKGLHSEHDEQARSDAAVTARASSRPSAPARGFPLPQHTPGRCPRRFLVTLTGDRQPDSRAQCRTGWKLLLRVKCSVMRFRGTNKPVRIVTNRELISH